MDKHVVLAIDNNYALHSGVTIENNKDDSFVIHVLCHGINRKSKEQVDKIEFEYS